MCSEVSIHARAFPRSCRVNGRSFAPCVSIRRVSLSNRLLNEGTRDLLRRKKSAREIHREWRSLAAQRETTDTERAR